MTRMDFFLKKIELMDDWDIQKDWEGGHRVEDEIYEKFIKDISNDKFSGPEMIKIAKLIRDRVIEKKNVIRWYS